MIDHEAERTAESGLHRIGPLRVADAAVYIDTPDDDFAAVVRWSFRDLVSGASDDAAATYVFEVKFQHVPYERWAIWRNGEACQLTLEERYTLFHLQWELNRIVLERQVNTIHAAGAAFDDRCVVLVGASGSGKTTLTGYLSARGAAYVADEVVTVDAEFAAIPYQRPLGLRFGGPLEPMFSHPSDFDRRFDRYEMLVPVSALGQSIGLAPRPVPIAALVFPRYTAGDAGVLAPLGKADALRRLCESAPGIDRHGRSVFRTLSALVARTPTAEMIVDDLETARSQLIDFVDRTAS